MKNYYVVVVYSTGVTDKFGGMDYDAATDLFRHVTGLGGVSFAQYGEVFGDVLNWFNPNAI